MNLVLDTGSSNTAVISDQCNNSNCTFVQKPYLPVNPKALLNNVSARYGNAKTSASWHGYATGQQVHLHDNQSVFARVDVITSSDHFFVPACPQNQGLWGLAYPQLQTRPHNRRYLNRNRTSETLFDAARKQLHVPDAFTFQLCSKSTVDPLSAHGLSMVLGQEPNGVMCEHRAGHFWLGGYASPRIQSPIVWVPMKHSRYYEVEIDSFLINGKPIRMHDDLNVPRTIVDTGTNDIILSTQNLHRFLLALWKSKLIRFDRSYISPEYERAFWLDHAQLTIPSRAVVLDTSTNVSVSLSGQEIPIPLENLVKIHPLDNHHHQSTWINISWAGLSHGGGTRITGTILGNTLMRGKTTIWDRGAGRLGFAEVDPSVCCQASSASDVDTLLSPAALEPTGFNDNEIGAGTWFVHGLSLTFIVLACIGGLLHTGWMVWHHYTRPKEEENVVQQTPVVKIDLPMPCHVSDGDFEII
ncbi:aspartic peptidase domain-containing protein [Fennellomyces sp. T-0311]|nr:aspartic peptidase domain-containing protein [Fennellomyces sp. T-0311]